MRNQYTEKDHSPLKKLSLEIDTLWGSTRSCSPPYANIILEWQNQGLFLRWNAQFHQNPPPPFSPVDDCWGLWNYEVVELFIVGRDEHYLELEWGPYGHHLTLKLKGVRTIYSKEKPSFLPEIIQSSPTQWTGSYCIPYDFLPPPQSGSFSSVFSYQVNAFAIWGEEVDRTYAVAFSLEGSQPDFHQIHQFPSFNFLKTKL